MLVNISWTFNYLELLERIFPGRFFTALHPGVESADDVEDVFPAPVIDDEEEEEESVIDLTEGDFNFIHDDLLVEDVVNGSDESSISEVEYPGTDNWMLDN